MNLSGLELAQMVGYKHQSAIGNLENRAGGSGGHKIGDIAEALGVPVEWLLKGPDCDQVPFKDANTSKHETNTATPNVRELPKSWASSQWPFAYVTEDQFFMLTSEERQHIESDILIRLKNKTLTSKQTLPGTRSASG